MMRKMTKLTEIFTRMSDRNHYLRVGESSCLRLYVGLDDGGHYALEFRGRFDPVRLASSDVISVFQSRSDDCYVLTFALERRELLEYFCVFCQDLLNATACLTIEKAAYQTLCARYLAWKQLFRPHKTRLTEAQVMGLIGELLFLKEQLIPQRGAAEAVASWMGPERTHKDFSAGDWWCEVKAISTGKDVVRISSVEQLDGEGQGHLAVYALERMSPSYSGLTLGGLVLAIMSQLANAALCESFMAKLCTYGFDFSPGYESYVFSLSDFALYAVGESFPRLRQSALPSPISHVQYDLALSAIGHYKLNDLNTPIHHDDH